MNKEQVFRVLSIDGGGMRGYYSSAYLQELVQLAKNRFDQNEVDLSKKFHLVVGTSTGAIVGAGLLAGLDPSEIMAFYENNGKLVFPKQLPTNRFYLFFHPRKKINRQGNEALRNALTEVFGNITLGDIFQTNGIAFAIPTVDAITHNAWVFKTPHNNDTNHRDDKLSLVDICLASSAAPIYRSLAVMRLSGQNAANKIFVDGGLWANNPVLVALSEALRMTNSNQRIEIFCLGTSPEVTGAALNIENPHWGLFDWHYGAKALRLSLDAQTHVFEYLAKSFLPHLDRNVTIIRFPQITPSANQAILLGLDSATQNSLGLMRQFASSACDETNRIITNGTSEGVAIESLLTSTH